MSSALRVLRISHSSVVTAWRQRERELVALGIDVELLCAAEWEEGGGMVSYTPDGDRFATATKTYGHHPNLFVFDPRKLWQLLGDRSFDVIDIHEEPFSLAMAEILLLMTARRMAKPYVVYSAQNLDKRYPFPFSVIEALALRRAAAAQVCNREAGQRLRRRGLRGELAVLALGVDLEHFRPADRPPPENQLRVGYVGRLAEHKGLHVLLEAMAPRQDWTLELVGEGPDRQRIVEQANALAMADRISLLGHAGQDELAARYRRFDVVVVPSIPTPRWTEQFGRVVVEAMASGVPVISSDAGALREVVGEAGLVVPAGDAEALRQALCRLAGDPELWLALRTAGLRRAQEFTWASVAAKQSDLYLRIAG
jgi:glycosyltransferase involved in cell wall biosynthesis